MTIVVLVHAKDVRSSWKLSTGSVPPRETNLPVATQGDRGANKAEPIAPLFYRLRGCRMGGGVRDGIGEKWRE